MTMEAGTDGITIAPEPPLTLSALLRLAQAAVRECENDRRYRVTSGYHHPAGWEPRTHVGLAGAVFAKRLGVKRVDKATDWTIRVTHGEGWMRAARALTFFEWGRIAQAWRTMDPLGDGEIYFRLLKVGGPPDYEQDPKGFHDVLDAVALLLETEGL